MASKSLQELREQKTSGVYRTYCKRCSKRAPEVYFASALRERDVGGKKGTTIVQRNRVLCEPCALEVWAAIEEVFERG